MPPSARRSSVRGSRGPAVAAAPVVAEPYRIGFLLIPEFPMMAFAAAIEPLRSANRLTGSRRFEWQLFSRDGAPVRVTTDIFAIDANRYTCAGGTSALDMMLQVIAERDGRDLANAVSEQFIHARIRGTRETQRMAAQSRLGVANEKLVAAVALME